MQNRLIDRVLNKSFKIKSIEFKAIDLIFVLVLWVMAFMVRFRLYPIESGDYTGFLRPWMQQIKELGAWMSLSKEISNYGSGYMYLMCIVSGFDNTLYALKTISVIFDYIASIAVFLIIYNITLSTRKSIIAMAMILLSPTVILDSAYWCQCDVIYTSFILWAIYFFFKDNSSLCFVFIGLSLCFKLQAVLILPFIVIMYLKNKNIHIVDMVYVPAVFIIAQMPAWIAGRPLWELVGIYVDQAGYYPYGTLEYPNIYAIMDEQIYSSHYMNEVSGAGMWFAIILLGFIAYYIYGKNIDISIDFCVTLALFTVAVSVYTLPHMHDRYGYLIDLLAVIYGVLKPKRLPVTIGFMLISIMTFMPYLIGVHVLSIQTVAILLLGLIVYVGCDLYRLSNIAPTEPVSSQEAI